MKKIFKLFSLLIVLFACLIISSCEETIHPLDYILNYDIEVNPRIDGSLDMKYHINWKVLDDSSEGPLEWVKIGIPNKYVDEIKSLSSNIGNIDYYSDSGAYIRIDFTLSYYKNETVYFSFSFHQSRFYTLDGDKCNYQFITGWFDKIQVEKATVKWKKDNVIYTNATEEKDGYYYYEYSLDYGKSIEVLASYNQSSFEGLDKSKGYSGNYKTKEDITGQIALFVFLAIFIFSIIFSLIKKDFSGEQYMNYRGFVVARPMLHNHYLYVHHYVSVDSKGNRIVNPTHSGGYHGGGSGCACACACACAGGGRAGCTRKSFYKKDLDLKNLKESVK